MKFDKALFYSAFLFFEMMFWRPKRQKYLRPKLEHDSEKGGNGLRREISLSD
ncbi:hypothetical protein Q644_18810 [Brucella intermedia 229E]|uniref:Uncharacterized protein n=1 Tax=Brucella intermedia 229E TaxID=1337887 RepID=U4VGV0_9HYPH|nr:hypothetical protein Q644_18810 [Brucella intermedia 229E]